MNTRQIVIFSILFLLASLYSVNVVTTALLNRPLISTNFIEAATKNVAIIPTETCQSRQPLPAVKHSSEAHLKKLAEYQQVCHSFVTNELMIFTDMPKDANDARQRATKNAETLLAFKQAGVKPLVMVEPVSEWGLIDFQEFGTGFYDDWINTYFLTLKEKGLTDKDLGTWVPFPEANLPYWNHANATPQDYATVVNRYLGIMKQHFPQAEGSVLLNSATYETTDFEWANGDYRSLSQYVQGLDKNLVTSFGMQGFPWMPPANQTGPGIFDAGEYLNSKLAMEAADILGTKKIWLNTGSFSAKYTLDPAMQTGISAAKRRDILNGIINESLKLKKAGYDVRINLFAEDKSQVTEATNWSYFSSDTIFQSEHSTTFISFARRLNQEGIGLSLFDVSK